VNMVHIYLSNNSFVTPDPPELIQSTTILHIVLLLELDWSLYLHK